MTAAEITLDAGPATTGALTAAEVAVILARLDPAALQHAGAAQTQLGRELATMAAHLAQETGTLTQNWSGVAARAALTQLQRLHQQTATLATQATGTGVVLTWLGTQVLPALNHPATPTQARQFLTHLTAALTQADKSLPVITSGRTTSPGVTTSHPVPTPPRRPNLISIISVTGHSGQSSPTGPPLISGSTHPVTQVSSLQSAAPVPSAAATTATPAPSPAPSPAPTPVPSPIALANIPPAPGTTAAASDGTTTATPATSEAAPEADPTAADVTPATITTPPTPVTSTTATKGRTTSPRDPDDHHQSQPPSTAASPGLPAPATVPSPHPAATSALPSFPGVPAAAPAPEVTASSPAFTARPLPQLPTLNSDLSGGALPLPPQPVTTPAITPVSGPPALAPPGFLPPAAGVPTPPTQQRHRESWTTDDPSPWAFPADCVPPLVTGG